MSELEIAHPGREGKEGTLEALKYTPVGADNGPKLVVVDQLLLPHIARYEEVQDTAAAFHVIKTMKVRGAPLIAIVAALSLAVELDGQEFQTPSAARKFIETKLDEVVTARPTAVNLSRAVHDLKQVAAAEAKSAEEVVNAVTAAAEQMLEDDISDNKAIGDNGAKWIVDELKLKPEEKIAALTICNTGSLATAGYGTALGVIRSLHAQGRLEHTYFLETRPYFQGLRLTAFELLHDKIPSTMITDSMAAILLKRRPEIKLVVVGADRVAKNGDTANKIGTFQLSIISKQFPDVKFVVAAPTTTVDLNTASGDEIVIEERKGQEVTVITGFRDGDLDQDVAVPMGPDGLKVWNPAFDVTPLDNIDAIVTEKKVHTKREGAFDLGN